VGAIRRLLGCGQVANIGGSLPLGIFDKWQNHFFFFLVSILLLSGILFFPFFPFFYSFLFFSFPQKQGVIFPIQLRNHFSVFLNFKLN
jgi:hypothetical protein